MKICLQFEKSADFRIRHALTSWLDIEIVIDEPNFKIVLKQKCFFFFFDNFPSPVQQEAVKFSIEIPWNEIILVVLEILLDYDDRRGSS